MVIPAFGSDAQVVVDVRAVDNFSGTLTKAQAKLGAFDATSNITQRNVGVNVHKIERAFARLGGRVGNIAGAFNLGMTAIVVATLFAGKKIIEGIDKSIKAFSELEDTMKKTSYTFGAETKKMVENAGKVKRAMEDLERMKTKESITAGEANYKATGVGSIWEIVKGNTPELLARREARNRLASKYGVPAAFGKTSGPEFEDMLAQVRIDAQMDAIKNKFLTIGDKDANAQAFYKANQKAFDIGERQSSATRDINEYYAEKQRQDKLAWEEEQNRRAGYEKVMTGPGQYQWVPDQDAIKDFTRYTTDASRGLIDFNEITDVHSQNVARNVQYLLMNSASLGKVDTVLRMQTTPSLSAVGTTAESVAGALAGLVGAIQSVIMALAGIRIPSMAGIPTSGGGGGGGGTLSFFPNVYTALSPGFASKLSSTLASGAFGSSTASVSAAFSSSLNSAPGTLSSRSVRDSAMLVTPSGEVTKFDPQDQIVAIRNNNPNIDTINSVDRFRFDPFPQPWRSEQTGSWNQYIDWITNLPFNIPSEVFSQALRMNIYGGTAEGVLRNAAEAFDPIKVAGLEHVWGTPYTKGGGGPRIGALTSMAGAAYMKFVNSYTPYSFGSGGLSYKESYGGRGTSSGNSRHTRAIIWKPPWPQIYKKQIERDPFSLGGKNRRWSEGTVARIAEYFGTSVPGITGGRMGNVFQGGNPWFGLPKIPGSFDIDTFIGGKTGIGRFYEPEWASRKLALAGAVIQGALGGKKGSDFSNPRNSLASQLSYKRYGGKVRKFGDASLLFTPGGGTTELHSGDILMARKGGMGTVNVFVEGSLVTMDKVVDYVDRALTQKLRNKISIGV